MFTDTTDNADPFLERMEEISLGYRGRLLFIEVTPDHHHLLSYFGLTKEVLPQVCLACNYFCHYLAIIYAAIASSYLLVTVFRE